MASPTTPGAAYLPCAPHNIMLHLPSLAQRISISNTVIAICAAPVIVAYADVSYVSRVGLASSLVLFGLLTTGEQSEGH